MKTSSIIAICCSTLVSSVHSNPVVGETFGGFAPGKIFYLTVTERESSRKVGDDTQNHVPVPKDLPRFKVGDKVKFTIGLNGQLKGPGFSIQFDSADGKKNVYANRETRKAPVPDTAGIIKNYKGNPKVADITFHLVTSSTTTNTVNYLFEK